MGRIEIDDFGDKEVARIYLAAGLGEAQMVEVELSNHGIDYAVEVERYMATAVFWVSEYAGAAFYIAAEQIDFCDRVLREAGLVSGLMEKQDQ